MSDWKLSPESVAAVVSVRARDGHADEVNNLLLQMAEVARADDGTEIWIAHRDATESARFFVYELYRDRAAFRLHRNNETLNGLGKRLAAVAKDIDFVGGAPIDT